MFTTEQDPPINDFCNNAIDLTPASTCNYISGTTIGSTGSMPGTPCNNFTANSPTDVWYTFEATGIHDYVITMDMTVDGILVLYTQDCGNLVYVDCADNNFSSGIETINAGNLDAGTYFVRVYGWNSQGNFNICVEKTESFVVSNGVFDECNEFSTIQTGSNANWVNITDGNGGIVSSVFFPQPNGNVDFDPTIYLTSDIREDGSGQKYVGRDINIESSENGFSENLLVRLYYTNAEIDALIAADDNVSSIGDINITKTEGDCTGGFNGEGTFYPQVASGTYAGGYFIDIEVNSFSTFFAHGGLEPLPVHLLSFTGETFKGRNTLSWVTENEIDLSHYIVERSEDGRNFELLSEVDPTEKGTDGKHTYQINDHRPYDKTYYRLVSVDMDWSRQNSNIIVLHQTTQNKLTLFPNPADRMIYLSGTSNADVYVQIADIHGRVVHYGYWSTDGGLDISYLHSGVYVLQIAQDDNTETIRFVKTN